MLHYEEIERAAHTPAQFIKEAEDAYTQELTGFVDELMAHHDHRRHVVALSGPSGSGKTTSASRIGEILTERGVKAALLSLDDFYLGKNKAPLLPDGSFDFETVRALDLPLLHDCIEALLGEGRAMIPRFDFKTGAPAPERVEMVLGEGDVVIVEGIHAMNPQLVEALSTDRLTRLYISIEQSIMTPDGELTGRDLRLIRRLTRDFIHRNSSPENTLSMWVGVVHGEENYLFPYKDTADYTLNSIHAYEPCLFREVFVGHMNSVTPDSKWYAQATTLRDRMAGFTAIDRALVPENSIMREFID